HFFISFAASSSFWGLNFVTPHERGILLANAAVGAPGAFRFGSSWVSQGMSGRRGGGTYWGLPLIVVVSGGAGCTFCGSGLAELSNCWLLPSERRLSPDRPGNECWNW